MIKATKYFDKAYQLYKDARKAYDEADEETKKHLDRVQKNLASGKLNRYGKREAQNSIGAYKQDRDKMIEGIRDEFAEEMDKIIEDVTDVFKPLHGIQAEELDDKTIKLIESGMLSETETRELLKDATPTTFRYCVNKLDRDRYSDLYTQASIIADRVEVGTLEGVKSMFLRGLRVDRDLADGIDKYIRNAYAYEAREALEGIEVESSFPMQK